MKPTFIALESIVVPANNLSRLSRVLWLYIAIVFTSTVSAQTPIPINPGERKSGTIGVAGEIDAYTFSASVGQRVSILMTASGSSMTPRIQLRAPDGSLVADKSGFPAAEVSALVLTTNGTYQIICRSAEGNTIGNYALTLVNDPGANLNEQVIQPGQTLAGGIVLGELDVFTFTATVGQRVSIVITASGSSMSPRIQLRGPDGSLVADKSGFPAAEVSAQVLNQSGIYQIICRSAEGNTIGNYALTLVNDPGSNLNERAIQPGQTLAGGIVLGESDVFTFFACQGERITIVMTVSGSSMTPRIQLRGPDGSLVVEKLGFPAAEVSAQALNQSGTYQIICRSAEGNTTGSYALTTIRHFWPNAVDVGGGGIQSGESKLGNVTLGDLDVFAFSGYAGEVVDVAMTQNGSTMTPRLQIQAPDGTIVTNTAGFPTAEVSSLRLGQSGTYFVICRSAEGNTTGDYTLSLSIFPFPFTNPNRVFLSIVGCDSRTVNEESLVTFQAFASGPNLVYSLDPIAPAGAIINPTSGLFIWTPTEAQGPGTYNFTVRASDSANPTISTATQSVTLTVNEVNIAPVLPVIASQTIDELITLVVTNTAADVDIPTNALTYALIAAPIGATIGTNGVITWTPTEAQGPSTNTFIVKVTDNNPDAVNEKQLSITNSFVVLVNEVNTRPLPPAIANRAIDEQTVLTITNTATDGDIPTNALTYSLLDSPSGAVISPTGIITWTPTENQGPSTNTFVVKVTDDNPAAVNEKQLSATNSFVVIVREANTSPVLDPIGGKAVDEQTQLTFTATATDADRPVFQTLTFSLDLGAPPGASINPTNGLFTWTPTEVEGPGSYPITIRVTDNGTNPPALSDFEIITVTVREVNLPPVLGANGNKIVDEGALLTFSANATDQDRPLIQTLTYSLDAGAPTNASMNPATGIFTWTPTEAQGPGSYPITIRVTDNGTNPPALSDFETITVTVREVNTAPVLSPITNRTITELTLLVITNVATDSDVPTNTLIFSRVGGPTNAAIDPSSGVLTWTPTEAQGPSTNLFTIRVTDNGTNANDLSQEQSFTVIVTESNSPPLLTQVPTQIVDEMTSLVLPIESSDPDIPTNTLTVSLVSAPAYASFNPATKQLTLNPDEPDGPGTNIITLRIVDDGSPPLTNTMSFTNIVREINRPPVLPPLANTNVLENANLVVIGTAFDPDLPANNLSYRLVNSPGGANVDASGIIRWTPGEALGGTTNNFTVIVDDNGSPNLNATNSFLVTVIDTNSPPILAPIADQTINEGEKLTLTTQASDPDIPTNILTFSLVTARSGMTIDAITGVIMWQTSEADGPSTNPVTVRVFDNGSPAKSHTTSFQVIVNELNQPPLLTIAPDQTIDELTTLVATNSATDLDIPANALTFALVSAPTNAVINATNGIVTWTPSEAQGPSTNVFVVSVTDTNPWAVNQKQFVVSNSFTVVVFEINSLPVPSNIATQTVNEGTLLVATNTATDPDFPTNALAYVLLSAPPGMTIDANGIIAWTPTEDDGCSNFVVTVKVTDTNAPARNEKQLAATNIFTVVVNEINLRPRLTLPASQTIPELNPFNGFAVGADDDVPANALAYSLVSGPPGLTVNSNSGAITWTPDEAQGPSTNLIAIRVMDNSPCAVNEKQLSVTNSFTLVVQEINAPPDPFSVSNRTVDEAELLSLSISTTDPDIPANALTYTLMSGPQGASVNPVTGAFLWMPGEPDGPSTNQFCVTVCDNGTPSLCATSCFTVIVNELNQRPQLSVPADQVMHELATLCVTATAIDLDVPTNALTFSLLSAPSGMTIDANTGAICWTPTAEQGPSTNVILVQVADTNQWAVNARQLTVTNSFTVTVQAFELTLQYTNAVLTIQFPTMAGESYHVDKASAFPAGPPPWVLSITNIVGTGSAAAFSLSVTNAAQEFFRVRME